MSTDLATTEALGQALALPDRGHIQSQLATIATFQETVHKLLKDTHDYGVIPGTGSKPTLLKPGAEKIAKLLNAEPRFNVTGNVDWRAEPPFFDYDVECVLYAVGTDVRVAAGLGNCNSGETKYKYRWEGRGQDRKRVLNMETASEKNTILKMAKKRALVDAVLGFATLSEVFTQDLEDRELPAQEQTPPAHRQQRQDFGHCDWHDTPFTRKARSGAPFHEIDGTFCNGEKLADKQGNVLEERQTTMSPQEFLDSDEGKPVEEEPDAEPTSQEMFDAMPSASQAEH